MLTNNTIAKIQSPSFRQNWWFYPDTFCFLYSREQYLDHWEKIKTSAPCLITKDMYIKPVTLTKYTWHQIKASTGYTADRAHPAKIQMAMLKLLYAGYVHNFNETLTFPPEFLAIYPLPADFLHVCKQPRNNARSELLQSTLISFYNQNSDKLVNPMTTMPATFDDFFGKSYLLNSPDSRDLHNFVKLDSQNITAKHLKYLKNLDIEQTLPGSKLRHLIFQDKLTILSNRLGSIKDETAVTSSFFSTKIDTCPIKLKEIQTYAENMFRLCPDLLPENSGFFIQLYFSLAAWEPQYYKQAWTIIKVLHDNNVFSYLNQFFLENDHAYSVIEKNSSVLNRWLEQLYPDVVSNATTPQNQIKGCRILSDNPSLIKTEHLSRFIDIALKKNMHIEAIRLIERLFLTDQEAAFHYINNNTFLIPSITANTEFSIFIANKIASQSTFTMNPLKILQDPWRLFAPTKQNTLRNAKSLDVNIEAHSEAALGLRFSDLVQNQAWDAAWNIFSERQQKGLSIRLFKQKDRIALAEYFSNEAKIHSDLAGKLKSNPAELHEARQLYYKSIDALMSANRLYDTQEYRFQINRHCRLQIDVIRNQPKSQANYQEANELLDLMKDYPCDKKDVDLPRTLACLHVYFNHTNPPMLTIDTCLEDDDMELDGSVASMV